MANATAQIQALRHGPLTWIASLGFRLRADTLPDLVQVTLYEVSEQIVGNSA